MQEERQSRMSTDFPVTTDFETRIPQPTHRPHDMSLGRTWFRHGVGDALKGSDVRGDGLRDDRLVYRVHRLHRETRAALDRVRVRVRVPVICGKKSVNHSQPEDTNFLRLLLQILEDLKA